MSDNKEVATTKNVATEKNVPAKKANTKSKGPNFFVRVGRTIKRSVVGMVSELKKVSWPTLPKALKQTGVVIVVVLLFLVVITAFDFGLQKVLTLITDVAK